MKRNVLLISLIMIAVLIASCAPDKAPKSDAFVAQMSTTPIPSRTPDPFEGTRTAEAYIATQTQVSRQDLALAIEKANADATLIAAQVKSTQLSAQQTAIVASTEAAQTQVAYAATQQSFEATQAAVSTATSIAIEIVQANIAGTKTVMEASIASTQAAATSTAQSQAVQDAFATTATQASFNINSTLDVASASAMATAQAARAQDATAAAERVMMTNQFIAWMQALAPILALIALAGVLYICGWFWWRVNKAKILHPNASGAYPIVYDNGRLLNSQRSWSPIVDPSSTNNNMPKDEAIQGQIALSDISASAVRAVAAGNTGSPQTALRVQSTLAGGIGQSNLLPFRISQPGALPADLQNIIEADWREETRQ